MKVAFDASSAAFRLKTGTGVYTQELIKAYQEEFPDDQVIHTYRLSRRIRGLPYLLPLTSNSRRQTIIGSFTGFRRRSYDIFHGLNSRLPDLRNVPMVSTVHDLFSISGLFSSQKFRNDQSSKLLQMISRSSHIIVPATFTKSQIIENLGISGDKITVVSEGVRDPFLKEKNREESRKKLESRYGLTRPFLLFVGTLEKRKNIVGLIKAYIVLSQTQRPLPDLVLVGGKGFQFREIAEEMKDSKLEDKIKLLGFVADDTLADLYRASEAFLFLSFEEGFGIPVIEAMACGAPVITSNTTSLPEVGSGFTWLVNPNDPAMAGHLMAQVLQRTEKILDQARRGQAYARKKTWRQVARDTREVYSKLI